MSIREAAEDSEISVAALSKVIGRDAALSARLIKVVNSPLLRAAVEVTDLHTAITRLGINYSCNGHWHGDRADFPCPRAGG